MSFCRTLLHKIATENASLKRQNTELKMKLDRGASSSSGDVDIAKDWLWRYFESVVLSQDKFFSHLFSSEPSASDVEIDLFSLVTLDIIEA